MKITVKTFIIIILLVQSVFAVDSKYYKDKFDNTKKLYIGSIMSNNKAKEIDSLKKLIIYGDKLKIDTFKYRKELNKLDNTPIISNKTKSILKKKPVKKPVKKTVKKTFQTKSILSKKYNIASVIQSKNTIIISFNNAINKSYIDFNERKSGQYYYDEFDIKGNFKDASPTKLKISGIDKITIFQKKKNLLSLSLKNKTNLKTIYIINKKQIIIKILNLKDQREIKDKVKVINSSFLNRSKKIIVIDAGHGGRDIGASYKKLRYEKDVTLKISNYLKSELQRKGFIVYLTRTSDKYIKLSNRTKYANKKNADIFISIHANAAPKSRASTAHGIEAYFLSPARSARAKRVAASENKGDMSGMGWSSKDSLLTILNQAKITAANKMAIDIQKNMLYSLRKQYGEKNIRDGGVREGPFWVLVGAQMPSVLVEVGYISHPKEGYRITTKRYQKLIAEGIAKGVESYFIKNYSF